VGEEEGILFGGVLMATSNKRALCLVIRSILCIGMGGPMMDFAVREACGVLEGPIAMIRVGSCGGLRDTPAASVAVATKGAVHLTTVFDGDEGVEGADAASPTWRISKRVPADAGLSALLAARVEAVAAERGAAGVKVVQGSCASADSFYSTQARRLDRFGFEGDKNAGVIDELERRFPDIVSLEMEHFHLLALANRTHGRVRAAAAAVPALNRHSGTWATPEAFALAEDIAGDAALAALANFKF
jgi:uridine phosphorylase